MIFNLKKNRIKKQNRKRFENIISDSRFNYLENIFNDFNKGKEFDDNIVKGEYEKFSKNIQTNTISAAELEFVIVATICSNNPKLTNELLKTPLLLLVYSFGNKITYDTVLKFISGYILHPNAEPYGGIPNEKAILWLNEYFKNNEDIVQTILENVIEINNKELGLT